MKNTTIYIFVGVILTALTLGALLFEFRDVPDVSWRQNYLPESKDPYGTWMFKSLLEERYGTENVLDRYKEIKTSEIDSSEKHLLVMIGQNINLDFAETESLANFSNIGNDILIISEDVKFDYDWGIGEINKGMKWDSSATISYPKLTDNKYDIRFKNQSLDKSGFKRYRYLRSQEETDQINETLETLKKSLGEESDDYNQYDDYNEEEEEESEYVEDRGYGIGFTQDSNIIFKEWEFYPEIIQIHTLPYVFTNVAARSPEFLDHFNKVIGYRAYDKIIFEHPSFNTTKRGESKSPLQFILANQSLKWAYYTLIIGALLYVIFKGKRRQKIVPTLEPNNNTSLEYVKTLGSLYEHQDKPRKLVKHLNEIFAHHVKGRYFLDINDGAFTEKLSKKSNINIEEIDLIVKTFKTINTRFDFTETDLSMLYRRLDAFYKNCK